MLHSVWDRSLGNPADRNFKGPFYTLAHVRYRLKRDTGVLERGLGSVGDWPVRTGCCGFRSNRSVLPACSPVAILRCCLRCPSMRLSRKSRRATADFAGAWAGVSPAQRCILSFKS